MTTTTDAPEPDDTRAASLDQAALLTIVCASCGRQRTLADDYDYNLLQLVTGRPLGWFNGDGEQMCGTCLGLSMRGLLP